MRGDITTAAAPSSDNVPGAWCAALLAGARARAPLLLVTDGELDAEEMRMAEGKSRHGCLAAWLIMMVAANVAMVPLYLLCANTWLAGFPAWTVWLSFAMALANVLVALALWHWKKWGFWLDCAVTVVSFVINFYQGLGFFALFAFLSTPILYGVLHIGGDNKGWPQLE
jgi:hypothetical protein